MSLTSCEIRTTVSLTTMVMPSLFLELYSARSLIEGVSSALQRLEMEGEGLVSGLRDLAASTHRRSYLCSKEIHMD